MNHLAKFSQFFKVDKLYQDLRLIILKSQAFYGFMVRHNIIYDIAKLRQVVSKDSPVELT